MEQLDGPFSLAALPYSQMNELLSRSGDRMYSRPNDPPPPPPLMHPLGEIKPPSVIRWGNALFVLENQYLSLVLAAARQERRSQRRCVEVEGKVATPRML